jgi:hypothetical protein
MPAVRNSREFYEVEQYSAITDILSAWFLAQYVNSEKGTAIVQSSF